MAEVKYWKIDGPYRRGSIARLVCFILQFSIVGNCHWTATNASIPPVGYCTYASIGLSLRLVIMRAVFIDTLSTCACNIRRIRHGQHHADLLMKTPELVVRTLQDQAGERHFSSNVRVFTP